MDSPEGRNWRIVRQDSNGNRFIEAKNLSDVAADAFVKARERQIGDHHQAVWKQNQTEKADYPEVLVTPTI